eukprot:512565_1
MAQPTMKRTKSSKLRHSMIRAKMKLTNTKQSVEPEEIRQCKARLKSTKKLTTSVEQIARNLYWSQHECARLVGALCTKLSDVDIIDSNDRFGILMGKMGRVHANLREIDELYLMNAGDELLNPLGSFNAQHIKHCQDSKLALKTIKGEYDLMRSKDEHKALKLHELESHREDFIQCVSSMELEKSSLLNSMQEYMESYKAYALMKNTIQHNTCNDSLIVKQGVFKKRGQVNKGFKKRWFKLFVNAKLSYSESATGMLRGHANLSDMIAISSKKECLIEIQTGDRTWVFQYDNEEHRDDWYETFNATCKKSMKQTAADFGNILQPQTIERRDTMNGEEGDKSRVLMSFEYPSRVDDCVICNDGHTVQINVRKPCVWCIHGERYVLRAFNFHTPSEHTIDAQRYEMEMHLIHTAESDASQVAVLAFIFTPRCRYKKGRAGLSASGNHKVVLTRRRKKHTVVNVPDFTDEDDDGEEEEESEDDETDVECDIEYDALNENDFLKQFWHELPLRQTATHLRLTNALNFDYLFATASDNFEQNVQSNEICMDLELLEYTGPLTTPPYTEGVKWFVSKKKHFVARKQLHKLSLCCAQL